MKPYKTIDEYLENFTGDTRKKLDLLRKTILEIAPDAVETISYGMPTFKLNGKNLVHFAGYSGHIGFYPGSEAIEVFATKLGAYITSKGTIQFSLDKNIPVSLVQEITSYRVAKEKR